MNVRTIPFKNIIRKPARSAALSFVVLLLSFSLLGGTLAMSSLQSGLNSLETRLGADIIAVPDTAKSKTDLESLYLKGVPGYFYMDREYLDKIAAVDGVEAVSPQYYLASVSSGCCSIPVQIIGFDPETDFSVMPWIKQSGGKNLGRLDVVAGCNINRMVGSKVTFYDVDCNIAAKLDETGTELDNAVFATVETVKELISASVKKGINELAKKDPDKIVSSVMIKVKDGYSSENVTDYINIYIRHVQAVRTKNMISGVADSLSGVSDIIKIMTGAVWAFVAVLMTVVFSTMINERKREFAVYRVIGMSRGKLAGMILTESLMISAAGSFIGCVFAGCFIYGFSGMIENQLGLPFLTPDIGSIAMFAAAAFVISVIVGSISASFAAARLSRVDAGLVLREGN